MGKKKNKKPNEEKQFSAEISADLTLDPISCRGPCKKQFRRNSFLKHIIKAKKCKHLYKAEELDLIKSQNYSAQLRKKNDTYKKQMASRTKVSQQKPAVNDDSTNTNQDIIFCKGPCGKKFPSNTFLKHVMHVKKCKGMYKEEELNSLKKVLKQINQERQKKGSVLFIKHQRKRG